MNFVSACSVIISIILCAVHHYHCTSAYTVIYATSCLNGNPVYMHDHVKANHLKENFK